MITFEETQKETHEILKKLDGKPFTDVIQIMLSINFHIIESTPYIEDKEQIIRLLKESTIYLDKIIHNENKP